MCYRMPTATCAYLPCVCCCTIGELDMEELRAAMKLLLEIKEAAIHHEKKMVRAHNVLIACSQQACKECGAQRSAALLGSLSAMLIAPVTLTLPSVTQPTPTLALALTLTLTLTLRPVAAR